MDKTTFAWVLFGIYLVGTAGLALWGMRKTKDLEGFALGNRDMGPLLVGITLAAAVASTATFVINPGFVYAHGVSALIHFGGAAQAGILVGLVVLSKGFRLHGNASGALTLPHWIGTRYDSPWMRTFFAVVNLALAVSFIVLIIKGSALVMQATLGLGYTASVVLIVGFVFSYIMVGGTYAHAYTNSLQGAMMCAVALTLVLSGIELFGEGLLSEIAAQDENLLKPFNPASPLYSNAWEVLITPFIVGFGLVAQPHILTKALYLKNDHDVNRYLLFAAVIGFIFGAILVVGLYARVTIPLGTPQDQMMAVYVNTAFSADWIGAAIAVALLAAGMSTMDGLLVSASTIAGNDLFLGALGKRLMPNASEALRQQKALVASRSILIAMGLVAFLLAIDPPQFVGLFAQVGVYGVVAASVAPLTFGIFIPSLGKVEAFTAAVVGLFVHLIHYGFATWVEGRFINPSVTASEGVIVSIVVLFLVRTAVNRGPTAVAERNAQ